MVAGYMIKFGDYVSEPMWVTMIFGFALPLAIAMSGVAAIGFLVKAAWFAVFSPSRVFHESTGDFEDAA